MRNLEYHSMSQKYEKVVWKIKSEVTKVSYQQTTEVGMELPNVDRTSLYILINNSAANQDIFMQFSRMYR